VIFDLSEDDDYADPGAPMMRLHPDGTRTVRQHGSAIYMRGDGATPEGERPFLDRHDLATGETTRLFSSPADAHESVLCLIGAARGGGGADGHVVIWHETPVEPPSLWVVPLGVQGAGPAGERRLLAGWPDPHPQLTHMRKRLVVTDRGDGVQL